MKKRLFLLALSLCMIFTLIPGTAYATEGGTIVSDIADINIEYNGTNVTKTANDSSYIFNASGASDLSDYTVEIVLDEGSVFTPMTPDAGDLYVDTVAENRAVLKFNVSVNDVNLSDSDDLDLILTSEDGSVWTGGFSNASDLTLESLADYLVNQNIQLAAGSLGSGSAAVDITVNQDDSNVMLILCEPETVLYTVDYVVDESNTITWKLPAGTVIPEITVNLADGQEIDGWYTDSQHSIAFVPGTTVTGNITLYANVTGDPITPDPEPEENTFYNDLTKGRTATIKNLEDWETFVAYADQANAGQLVVLEENIDCNNATYDPLHFVGNFDGGNNAISNAKFRSVLSAYYSSSEENIYCSGMFDAIGPGQIIANLKLNNVTAQYSATYAGILAGLADGASNNRALVQNIQVTGGSASGRTAAGVVGFTRNVDVKFCSSRDTTITGLANGGGVVGINNARVEFCYSTTSPTALPSLIGGSTGGVIAKNVRGGNNDYCWAYMTVVGAAEDGAGQNLHSFVADEDMDSFDFEDEGFDQECWMDGEYTPVDFDPEVVTYDF